MWLHSPGMAPHYVRPLVVLRKLCEIICGYSVNNIGQAIKKIIDRLTHMSA